MNSQKRLTPYLTAKSQIRSHSQQNYLLKANMTFMNRHTPTSPKLQNVSNNNQARYHAQCHHHNNFHHHCCCHSQLQPLQTYFPQQNEEKINELKEEVRRERFQNKLLLKQLQSKELFRERNSDLHHKIQEKVNEISKLNQQLDEKRREIQILKESNNWLKQQSLRLAKEVEQADKKLSQKDMRIGEIQANYQGDYMDFQKKLLELQKEVVEYKETLRELRETHKNEQIWKKESTQKIQNKLRSNNEISLCIENQDYYPLSTSTQTYLTGTDMDYGYSNASKMQDKLCEMINQNIVSEDSIFRRIRSIEQDLTRGMNILASVERVQNQLQLQAFKMSRQLRETQ